MNPSDERERLPQFLDRARVQPIERNLRRCETHKESEASIDIKFKHRSDKSKDYTLAEVKACIESIQKSHTSNENDIKESKKADTNESNLISQANTSPQTICSLNTSNHLKHKSIQDKSSSFKERVSLKKARKK